MCFMENTFKCLRIKVIRYDSGSQQIFIALETFLIVNISASNKSLNKFLSHFVPISFHCATRRPNVHGQLQTQLATRSLHVHAINAAPKRATREATRRTPSGTLPSPPHPFSVSVSCQFWWPL